MNCCFNLRDSMRQWSALRDDSADVIVNMTEITDAQRAQIEDVVQRKGNISPENIVISTMNGNEKDFL